jgi:hypothetical protein
MESGVLIGKLASANIPEQVSASKELARTGDPNTVRQLIPNFAGGKSSLNKLVVEAIIGICKRHGPPAVKHVIKGVDDTYFDIKDNCKGILSRLGIDYPYKKNVKAWWKATRNK